MGRYGAGGADSGGKGPDVSGEFLKTLFSLFQLDRLSRCSFNYASESSLWIKRN